ncbi:MAG: histidine kinase [Ferruginibacter sp.]
MEQKVKEIEILKHQVDPHFIFNSFNTLSFLIGEDSVKAKTFSEKLANVYRYIIFNSNNNLVGLSEELNFSKDYSFLQEIRYSSEIQIIFSNFSEIENILILPASIQILIENAIKHNEFNEHLPLKIYITLESDFITIENGKSIKKYSPPISSKIGLFNLQERCDLIMNRKLKVMNTDTFFKVELPVHRH